MRELRARLRPSEALSIPTGGRDQDLVASSRGASRPRKQPIEEQAGPSLFHDPCSPPHPHSRRQSQKPTLESTTEATPAWNRRPCTRKPMRLTEMKFNSTQTAL